jgi:hypothetical protein
MKTRRTSPNSAGSVIPSGVGSGSGFLNKPNIVGVKYGVRNLPSLIFNLAVVKLNLPSTIAPQYRGDARCALG